MSRTYRKDPYEHEPDFVPGELGPEIEDTDKSIGELSIERKLKSKRDGKHFTKSPAWFKKQRERARRRKRKLSIKNGQESPIEKKNNDWDWN